WLPLTQRDQRGGWVPTDHREGRIGHRLPNPRQDLLDTVPHGILVGDPIQRTGEDHAPRVAWALSGPTEILGVDTGGHNGDARHAVFPSHELPILGRDHHDVSVAAAFTG